MLGNCGLLTANYDATLVAWDTLVATWATVTLGANGLQYTTAGFGEAAKASLLGKGLATTGDTLFVP